MSQNHEEQCIVLTEHLVEIINVCYKFRDKLIDSGHKDFIKDNEIPILNGGNNE